MWVCIRLLSKKAHPRGKDEEDRGVKKTNNIYFGIDWLIDSKKIKKKNKKAFFLLWNSNWEFLKIPRERERERAAKKIDWLAAT